MDNTFYTQIEVGDIDGERFEQMDALVDTGAVTTVVPASVLHRLGIAPTKSKTFEYANGEQVELDMAPATVRVDGDATPTWVIFGAEQGGVMLGAHALEGLLLGVAPYGQRLIPVHGLLK